MHPEELCDTGIKICGHDSDYSVMYDFVDTRHVMCNSCWNEETQVRTGRNTVSILRQWQLRVANIVCLHCNTDVTAQGGCSRCFAA